MKRFLAGVLLLLCFSCDNDEVSNGLTLEVEVVPAGAGTVSPASGVFKQSEVIAITATPASGYFFREWQGDLTGTTPTMNVTMTSSKKITAVFGKLEPEIPYIRINTLGNTIVNEPKVPATIEIYADNELQLSSEIGIEYRGKLSFIVFDKKSYGFEFREAGNEVSKELLGMPADEDWILYASFNDKSLARSSLIYQLSNDIGRYAARTRWVELEVNNEYLGMYVLMEKVKRGPGRINIVKLQPEDNSPELITGGYVLKIDKTDGPDWGDHLVYTEAISFRSNFSVTGQILTYDPYGPKQGEETYFLYDNPKAENITPDQKAYIQNYIYEFESALQSEDFQNESRAYADYIDVSSFVDYFILNELAGNADAYRLSTFLYKDRGGKLTMGPVWDFDLSMGNDGRSQITGWIYNLVVPWDAWLVEFWWPKLIEDPLFRQAVKSRWNELRADKLSTAHMHTIIDDYASTLISHGVVERNFSRWNVFEIEPTPSNLINQYNTEVAFLKTWINDRAIWLDGEIANF